MAPNGREFRGKSGEEFLYRSAPKNEDFPMTDLPSAAFTDFDSWHPSGWSPVYDQVTSRRHLVGFTTLQCGLDRLLIAQETGDYRALPGFWAL